MVDFTQNLPNATSSRRIIDPGKSGPSWFEGIADIASQGLERTSRLLDQNEADARQRAASARQQAEDERQARERLAKDRAAAIMWEGRDRFAQPGAPMPLADNAADFPVNAPIDSELEGAPRLDEATRTELDARVDELRRAQAAEEQGRAPTGSFRVVMERNISALMAEMPDQTSEIFDYLKDAGFRHYLFREAEAEQQAHEANVTQEIAMRNEMANASVSRGLVPVGTDPNVAAQVGQRTLLAEYKAKQLNELEEAARAGNAEARAQYDFEQKRMAEDARRNFGANLSSVINPLWNQLTNLMTQGQGSAEALSLLPDALRNLDVIVENHISAARQAGVPEETITVMRSDWSNMRESAVGFVSGPASDLGVSKAALEGMQTRLGLQLHEALPTYMALQEVIPASSLATLFGGDMTLGLSQDAVNALKREIRGIQGVVDTNAERSSLANAVRILRGETDIRELTETEAVEQMPILASAVRGQAPLVAEGRGNPDSLLMGNLAIANAAMELQPGRATVNSEVIASATLFDNNQRRALDRMIRDNPGQGQLLADTSRAAAVQIWNNLRGHRLNNEESGGGVWGLRLNEQGRFEAVLDRGKYQRQAFRGSSPWAPGSGGTQIPYETARTRPPAALTRLVNAQNRTVDFLVETSKHDPDFQGVDHRSARDFYIHNRVPEAMRRRQQTEQQRTATFQEQSQAFRQTLDTQRQESEQLRDNATGSRIANEDIPPPQGLVQQTVRRMAEDVGVPWAVVNRLVTKESQWDVRADSGSSQGLFQVNASNAGAMTWEENAQEGLKRWVDANENAERVLGRAPTPGEAYVAYQQGPGGGVALLKPENANRPAIEVLRPLYRDAATARSAIIGNGGNLNMTAREFAQHIQDYFNR